ncbi:hypothetical protein ACIP4X_10445 [Streptomyces sp. NPDC088817]|uniref:hypothetical protein n=1 Tax=unclassified Streptomyces TaxID=2593676 RepID=UPI0036E45767
MAAEKPGNAAPPSIIETELARRAAEQDRARTGSERPLPPLVREYGYVVLTCSFLGYLAWAGLLALALWLLGADHRSRDAGNLLFSGWSVCWVLLFLATLLWHAPELLKREPGPRPKTANGFVGYLLRKSDRGVFDGSLPLTFDAAAPPPHFWLVAGLFTAFSGYWTLSGSGGLRGSLWMIPGWISFAACVASLGILTHGALTRRAARRRVAAKSRDRLGDMR